MENNSSQLTHCPAHTTVLKSFINMYANLMDEKYCMYTYVLLFKSSGRIILSSFVALLYLVLSEVPSELSHFSELSHSFFTFGSPNE